MEDGFPMSLFLWYVFIDSQGMAEAIGWKEIE